MAPTDESLTPSLLSPSLPLPAAEAAPTPTPNVAPDATGWLLLVLVAAVGFLLASFPARNSDVWAYLAAGRDVVRGQLPRAAELPADLRVGQTWLYGVANYGLYSAFGGAGLVAAKALLVAALGLLLARLGWVGRGWAVPAACALFALLAMGVRLLLQPATVSYLFLGLTLWLVRPRPPEQQARATWLPPWPLVALFIVWANVDAWFLLGLAIVALVWLGRAIDDRTADWSRLGGAVLLLGAACLLNPTHVGAFAPPPQLGPFRWPTTGEITSPFQTAYFDELGTRPAVVAYYPLLGLSLVTFFGLPRWPWQRFLPWLALAALSAWQARAIPFFAVVAGPVLACNLQELYAARGEAGPRHGRALTGLLGLGLLVCAWPGWLQAPPFEPRRWTIDTPPSLERGARAVCAWYEAGVLGPDDRGLHLSPDSAAVFAWFCPQAKGLYDAGLAAAVGGQEGAADDWPRRLLAAGVNHVVVYDTRRERLAPVLDRLLAEPSRWPLLVVEGDVTVFGWSTAAHPVRVPAFDADRLAFDPPESARAPRGPAAAEPSPWWHAFWKPAPPPSIDRAEALLHLGHAEAVRRTAGQRHAIAWASCQIAGLVGAAAGWTGPEAVVDEYVRRVLTLPRQPRPDAGAATLPGLDRAAIFLREQFRLRRDDTPPALLLLAVRAARRAIAGNPDDALARLALGEAYLRLSRATRERVWAVRMARLAQLRNAQAITALQQAVALRPDLDRAHLRLAELYQEMGYIDLALEHYRRYTELVEKALRKQAGGQLSKDQQAEKAMREQAAEQMRKNLERLAEEVEKRQAEYRKTAEGVRVYERALRAMRLGLAGKARDELQGSDVSAFGKDGTVMQLELMLRTGRAKEVTEWASPEIKPTLGGPAYHWLRTQALAALGEYQLAEDELAELTQALAPGGEAARVRVRPRQVMAELIGREVLGFQPIGKSAPSLVLTIFEHGGFRLNLATLAGSLRTEADLATLRGVLALEEGDVAEARRAFRQALALWRDPASAASGASLDFSGRAIAEAYLAQLE